MARCLVTGHEGYIGSRLYRKLSEMGHEVRGIDLKSGEDINGLTGLIESYDGSFHPRWYSFKPEYIFHLACIPRVAYSVEKPVTTMKNNVLAGSNVLNFARKVGAKRVIYSSSSSIVGNGDGPTNPYALQKMTTEIECKLYSELYGLDTVSLRYFNVYSEDQKAQGPYATAISNWMRHIRDGSVPFITGDGSQRRDMLHVQDAVDANIFAMNYENNFSGKNYDVGTGKNISLNEASKIVKEKFTKINFMNIPPRPGDVMKTKADIIPLQKIGWTAQIQIKDGIQNCFKNLKKEIENV